MKRWILLLLLAGCAAGSIEHGVDAGGPPETVVVASDLDNPPFAYVDADGRPAGRDVAMMRRLAERCGLALEWRRMPFDALLPACERGEVDVVCATLGVTPERAERVLFTRPYFETSIAVVVRERPGEPRSFADLSGRRVAAAAGTTAERAVRAHLPDAIGVFENKEGLGATQRLASRAVDAVALDGPAADALVAKSATPLRRLAGALADEDYALALSPGREALRDRLDAALRDLADEWSLLDARHGLTAR